MPTPATAPADTATVAQFMAAGSHTNSCLHAQPRSRFSLLGMAVWVVSRLSSQDYARVQIHAQVNDEARKRHMSSKMELFEISGHLIRVHESGRVVVHQTLEQACAAVRAMAFFRGENPLINVLHRKPEAPPPDITPWLEVLVAQWSLEMSTSRPCQAIAPPRL